MNATVLATLAPYAPHAVPDPAGTWQRWLAAWRAPVLCACGGALIRRKGKRGSFLGCSRYPDCRFTRDAPRVPSEPREERYARYLNKDEKAQASQEKKDKRAAKRAAKERKAAKARGLQPEIVFQLPVEGFDYKEWFGEGWNESRTG